VYRPAIEIWARRIEPLFLQRTGADRQLEWARSHDDRLPGLVAVLADAFCEPVSEAARPPGESPRRDFGQMARGSRDTRA